MTTEQQQIAPCPFCSGWCHLTMDQPTRSYRFVVSCSMCPYRSDSAHASCRADAIAEHNKVCAKLDIVPRLAEAAENLLELVDEDDEACNPETDLYAAVFVMKALLAEVEALK